MTGVVSRSLTLAALTLMAVPMQVHAESATSSDDLYARAELRAALLATNRAYWQSGPGDPQITFSINNGWGVAGAIGIGRHLGNGIRVDGSVDITGPLDINAAFLSASDGTAVGHVNTVTTTVSAGALMANLFVEPLAMSGYEGPIQPFLTGGLGVAFVNVGDWTRTNPTPPARPTRTFYGASNVNFAWSAGGGISSALGNGMPGTIELTYRYTDLGNAAGSNTPKPGSGASMPVEPFNFDLTTHTLGLGLRIPIGQN